MEVRADVEEPLDDAGVLGHGGHVQHVLPVVLLEGDVSQHVEGLTSELIPRTGRCRSVAAGRISEAAWPGAYGSEILK